jgi:hypothetical protein
MLVWMMMRQHRLLICGLIHWMKLLGLTGRQFFPLWQQAIIFISRLREMQQVGIGTSSLVRLLPTEQTKFSLLLPTLVLLRDRSLVIIQMLWWHFNSSHSKAQRVQQVQQEQQVQLVRQVRLLR